jgi:Transposase, Mutator family
VAARGARSTSSIRSSRSGSRGRNLEVPLATYAAFQAPPAADTGLFRQTHRGLSCGQYRETTEAVPEAFGLSPSTVSRRFIRASARKLHAAYAQPTYAEAKAALGRLAKELQLVNPSAVESLQEGLEETVTLHRLGLAGTLGASLQTTNCLESIFAQVEQRTAKVDHWRTSDQKQRCMAAALLDIEPRLRRIKGHRHLPGLQRALAAEVKGIPSAPAAQVAA